MLRKLGAKWSGGQQQNIKRWIKAYNLDTSHFLGQGHQRGKRSFNCRHWSEVLIYNESLTWRFNSLKLRRALLEYGRTYRCVSCGQDENWMGKKITLQINHKNNDWKDNRPDNLEFLCPNCHATTEGWSGSKGLTSVDKRICPGGVTAATHA